MEKMNSKPLLETDSDEDAAMGRPWGSPPRETQVAKKKSRPNEVIMAKEIAKEQPNIYQEELKVSPSAVVLYPPEYNKAWIIVSSTSCTPQSYEFKLLGDQRLHVGYFDEQISSHRAIPMSIKCRTGVESSFESALQISTNKDTKIVKIKVLIGEK